jgi:hypothetical protein
MKSDEAKHVATSIAVFACAILLFCVMSVAQSRHRKAKDMKAKPSPTPSVNQTMINSPGGIQAGRM